MKRRTNKSTTTGFVIVTERADGTMHVLATARDWKEAHRKTKRFNDFVRVLPASKLMPAQA